jgi:flagellar assembly protein FliH
MSSRVWSAAAASAARPWRADALGIPANALATKVDTEATTRAARDAGYAEGLAKGHREGLALAKAEAAKLAQVLAGARASWDELEEGLSAQVVDLAVELARQVLRDEPRLSREALGAVVREALKSVADDAAKPQIVVHPADVQTLRAHLGEDLHRGAWTIVEDLRMEPGGCRIATGSGEVDATMATRWRRVLATLGRNDAWVEPDA